MKTPGRKERESVTPAQALNPEPVDDLLLGSDLPFVLKAWVSVFVGGLLGFRVSLLGSIKDSIRFLSGFCWLSGRTDFVRLARFPQPCFSCHLAAVARAESQGIFKALLGCKVHHAGRAGDYHRWAMALALTFRMASLRSIPMFSQARLSLGSGLQMA